MTTTILALDLGTTTGWALRGSDGHITSGSESFRPQRFEGGGMRFLRFKRWLNELLSASHSINAVYFEEVRRHAGVDAAHVLRGDIEELANELKKGVDDIIQYRGSKQYLKNEAAVRRLKETLEKTDTRRVNTSDDDATKYTRAAGKAAVAMARATMRMLNVPTKMVTFYDSYVNFCIGIGRKSMSVYETR